MTVTYSREQRSKYNPQNYFHFKGAKYVKITVTAPPSGTVGSINLADLLLLENEMRVTRYYDLANNIQPIAFTSSQPVATDDELDLNWQWPTNAGYTHTQLEWTWLENEMESYYHVNGSLSIDKLFKNNATRIDLPYNVSTYRIPLLYGDNGRLYCRIRTVHIRKNGSRGDGPWSAALNPTFTGHHSNLNWQATTSFAEEGKRKAVIQYFDGSLRGRQTVTKDNVTNNTISAETFYDGEGRPAIQVLPVPGLSTKLGYTANLNLFDSLSVLGLNSPQAAGTDPAEFFDLRPENTLTNQTPRLQSGSGAALYYSPANTEKTTGIHKNIPDAEGYPYTVTRYTPDATGRIQGQSGVGAPFQMGKGHETKYYYGTAAQEELDGLFGTEAGNYTHYFKNMVKDANGQMSVSYTDMHGRTIATALAGASPANLVPLPLNATHYPNQLGDSITRSLLSSSTNVVKNNSIEAINTLLVPARTKHTFTYKLDPDKLSLTSCEGQAVCYDCQYDLEISFTEESGDQSPIIRRYSNVNLQADDNCNTGVQGFKDANGTLVANNTITDTITLDAGSWTVRKTLTINEASLAIQKQAWLQKGLCKTEQQLIDSLQTVMETITGCNTPVTPEPCTTCQTSQNLPTKRQLMLADMMPYGGQYAQDPQQAVNNTTFQQYNIFSSASYPQQPFFRNPLAGNQPQALYYNSLGQPDPVNDVKTTITREDFVSAFQYSWAEALLPRHPEYGKLLFAEANLQPSYNFGHSCSAPAPGLMR
ncbi:hypothetical protein [Paraflavitalea speifideaquila]|uniref:hypothetical protein n=1 Tax=Paraflavitalea speifideaquila TaxID=3076558 RepID=UPI0028EC3ADC|nr:hypothetical protein [Paraflavitalea speifideiaquila]